jgi:hypothetical protein
MYLKNIDGRISMGAQHQLIDIDPAFLDSMGNRPKGTGEILTLSYTANDPVQPDLLAASFQPGDKIQAGSYDFEGRHRAQALENSTKENFPFPFLQGFLKVSGRHRSGTRV